MKAIIYRKYGSADELKLEEVDKPAPSEGEVLVKVRTTSINSWDWEKLRGTPLLARLDAGIFRPRLKILGADVAGVVEAVGPNVTRLKPGDEVFGDISGCGWSGYAEYVCPKADALAKKPAGLSFENAAAIPQAGVMALQGLRKSGIEQKPDARVLINGAGGGVGTFAVQMAKARGAEVTGVDSAEKLETIRSAGADHVIDYTQEDFARSGQTYDQIIDCALHRPLSACRRALSPGGNYVVIGGATARIMLVMSFGAVQSRFSDKKIGLLFHKPKVDDLNAVAELVESGQVKPVIDKIYPLSEASQAFRYFDERHAKGKIVFTV